MSPVGTPVVTMHFEVETDSCTCFKLRCGGVARVSAKCSEHGIDSGPEGKFHTHAMQVDKMTVGLLAL